MTLVCLAALAALSLVAGGAAAQTVYRCGNEYTKVPCADGRVIDADSGPGAARRTAEAREVAARERRLADDMARDRRAREAVRPARAASLGPKPPAPAASASMKPKKKAKAKIRVVDERDFTATVPKPKKAPAAAR